MNASSEFSARIAESRARHLSPSIGAVWVENGKVTRTIAHGIPADGNNDARLWHIGSCTKTMTATLFARLVDQGKIGFDTPLRVALPRLESEMHPEFRNVRLSALLTHDAGVIANAPESTLKALRRSTASVSAQRRYLTNVALRAKPNDEAGYSNIGYVILGTVIEAKAHSTWEAALMREVIEPLGISSIGFGAPLQDYPVGHRWKEDQWQMYREDNPDAYGPAGRIHLSLNDWGKFLTTHLPGGSILTPATQARLHWPGRTRFAMGWIAKDMRGERRLVHTGSNTAWFAQATLVPHLGIGVGVVCNSFDERIEAAVGDLVNDLLDPAVGSRP